MKKRKIVAFSFVTCLLLSQLSYVNVLADEKIEDKIMYENIKEYQDKYGIEDITKSYQTDIDGSIKAISVLNKNINETKNNITLKEKEFKQLENEMNQKGEEIKSSLDDR